MLTSRRIFWSSVCCSSFSHASPLLLASLLLGSQIPLELSLEGLHVDLEAHLLVFGLLQLVLQLFKLSALLGKLLLHLPLRLFQFVNILVGGALSVHQVIQLDLKLASGTLRLIQRLLQLFQTSV